MQGYLAHMVVENSDIFIWAPPSHVSKFSIMNVQLISNMILHLSCVDNVRNGIQMMQQSICNPSMFS